MSEIWQEALHPRDEWGEFKRKNPRQALELEESVKTAAEVAGAGAALGAYPVAVRQGLFAYLRREAPQMAKFEMRENGNTPLDPNFLKHFAFINQKTINKLQGKDLPDTVANIYKSISHLDVEHGFVINREGKIVSAQRGGAIGVPIVGTLKDIHGWKGGIMIHNHPATMAETHMSNNMDAMAHSHPDMGLLFRHGLAESHVVTRDPLGNVHVYVAKLKDPTKIPNRAYRFQAYMQSTKRPGYRTTLQTLDQDRNWEKRFKQIDPMGYYTFEHHVSPPTGFPVHHPRGL